MVATALVSTVRTGTCIFGYLFCAYSFHQTADIAKDWMCFSNFIDSNQYIAGLFSYQFFTKRMYWGMDDQSNVSDDTHWATTRIQVIVLLSMPRQAKCGDSQVFRRCTVYDLYHDGESKQDIRLQETAGIIERYCCYTHRPGPIAR